MVKDCGMNFIRGSHYPHHPEFAARVRQARGLFLVGNVFLVFGSDQSDTTNWEMQCYPGDADAAAAVF